MTPAPVLEEAPPRTPSFRLEGRRALVAGAGRGIGAAAALALADAGAAVTLVARSLPELQEQAEAIRSGIDWLRIGGRYVIAGVVNPASMVTLDANLILRKYLTLTGVHNYHPRHLVQALEFVMANRTRYAFGELVDGRYALAEVGQAMADAASHRVLRAAIIP